MNIEELKRIAREATPGPWRSDDFVIEDMNRAVVAYSKHPHAITDSNSVFIATFNPQRILKMLEALEFYADKNLSCAIEDDDGEIAREALE